MLVEVTNDVYRDAPLEQALPFVQAAANGRRRILRIQRKQHHLIALRGLKPGYRFAGKRMPVTHSHKAARIQTMIFELGFQRAGMHRAFLEVTAQNDGAVRLYRRIGFRCKKTIYKAVDPTAGWQPAMQQAADTWFI